MNAADSDTTTNSTAATNQFVFTRTFDAPRDLVFKAWTEVDRLAQWWGPKGFKMLVSTLDLRPGGVFHYGMRAPNGQDMWGRFVYREVVAPERLAFIVSFSDEQGGVTRHPWSPDWPLEVLSTMTLEEHAGKTTVIGRSTPINATELEHKTFEAGHDSMQHGYSGTMDQLADYLAKAIEGPSQGTASSEKCRSA